MSLVLKREELIQELGTGIHLVIINDINVLKTEDGIIKKSSEGETGLVVEFISNERKRFIQTYWVGGKRQFAFDKLCSTAGIDNRKSSLPKIAAIGKRLFIAIREEHDLVNDEIIPDSKVYRIFRTYPYSDNKPAVMGDPDRNNGIPGNDFVFYKPKN
jgi:hypothetical protein